MKVQILSSDRDVAAYAAKTLWEVAHANAPRPTFVAFSGGTTPRRIYEILAEEFRSEIPWNRLHVFFVDERPVPPSHDDSNFRLALRLLLSRVRVPADQIHRMEGEAQDLDAAAKRYEDEVRGLVASVGGLPAFDLVWLGMGDDGHTASLFPDTAALAETKRLIVANEVAKLDAWRLTFTYPLLNNARRLQVIVTGDEKAPAVKRAIGDDAEETPALPVSLVRPVNGLLEWVIDRAAAAGMHDPDLLADS